MLVCQLHSCQVSKKRYLLDHKHKLFLSCSEHNIFLGGGGGGLMCKKLKLKVLEMQSFLFINFCESLLRIVIHLTFLYLIPDKTLHVYLPEKHVGMTYPRHTRKAHFFDLFDTAATRRNTRAPTAAMLLARSLQPE